MTDCSHIFAAQNVVFEPEALVFIWSFFKMCNCKPRPIPTEMIWMHIKVLEVLSYITHIS